jgi:hypothetical protein
MTADGEAADPTAFLAALVEDPTRAAVVQVRTPFEHSAVEMDSKLLGSCM